MAGKLIEMREAADVLGVSLEQAYSLARSGILPVVRLGRLVRVDPDRLSEWIARGGASFSGGWRKEA